ncbi:MAG: UDP-N-acetylmuramoyl-L-alanine--D-glutamate ligase [Candidatus Eremiobacteraeota bacterium]|nr:UDP-N-acetylmuramoyl-L-alanine--D-glutamate ligase [Candidatus Eremiobacteraeota bacterium]
MIKLKTKDMNKINLENKKISVLGIGKSGEALARVLSTHGARVLLSDSRSADALAGLREDLSRYDLEWETGGHTDRIFKNRDLVVVSPGVSIHLPVLQRAMKEGVHVIGEVEMAYRLSNSPFIAVTGTNGKSTTTTLIHETLKTAGEKSHLAGNIGIPLVGEVEKISENAWITSEISSFQLEAVEQFKPKVAVLLNITSDHIDRHISFSEYVNAKGNIFNNQNFEDFAILNADDEIVRSFKDKVKSRVLLFSRKHEVEEGAYFSDGFLRYRFNGEDRVLFSWEMIPLKGVHNLENVLAVVCVCLAAGVKIDNLLRTLQNFVPLRYRLEFVEKINTISFYNDSKGTNPDAVRASLESFREPLILIAGGTDKDLDFSGLASHIKKNAIHTVLIGESRLKIASALKDAGYEEFTVIDDMSMEGFRNSIHTAYKMTPPGGVVLLSPSCASFDMFKRAEHRGEMFNQFVRELKRDNEEKV